MEISGRVQNGVVVLDGEASLPDGASVIVTYHPSPVIRFAKNPVPVVLPIFYSDEPGTIDLTNDRIATSLDGLRCVLGCVCVNARL